MCKFLEYFDNNITLISVLFLFTRKCSCTLFFNFKMQQLARQRDMYKVLAQKGGVMVVCNLTIYSIFFFFLYYVNHNVTLRQ